MDSTERKLGNMFDYQKFEKEPKLQGVIDETISTSSVIKKLSDDELDYVAAGTGNMAYNDAELKKAGVIIKNEGGRTTYSTLLGGKRIDVSENVARGMVDCYNLAGGTRLTEQQIRDLIAQS